MPQLIPPLELDSLLRWFRPCFTRPAFRYFVDFMLAMVLDLSRCTTTAAFRVGDQEKHFTNYSRFLSEYAWSANDLMQRVFELQARRVGLPRDDHGSPRLYLILDETIVEKTSKQMFGVAWQRNTHGGWCRGTHILGHYWLMLGVRIEVAGRVLCLPLGFRLYRQKKRCPVDEYRTPSELAIELLESLQWPQDADLVKTIIADAGFADSKLLRWCVGNHFHVIVRGRMDAQVHDLYVPQATPLRGRPRKWGDKICLHSVAASPGSFTHTVSVYQNRTQVQVASVVGRHRASGLPLRFVITHIPGKDHDDDLVLMSTDLSLTPREVASLYADRFGIEMTFRELKQHFGLGDYQVQRPEAITRHVHLSAVACALTQLIALDLTANGGTIEGAPWQPMPWRKPDTLISLRETQLCLRQACLSHDTFAHVAPDSATARKASPRPRRRHTCPRAAPAHMQIC